MQEQNTGAGMHVEQGHAAVTAAARLRGTRKNGSHKQATWWLRAGRVALLLALSGMVQAASAPPVSIITTFAGNGQYEGSRGDGGQATFAVVRFPYDIVTDPTGNVYISENSLIRKVSATGIITTVLGDGPGAGLVPGGLELDGGGNLYVADPNHNRILKVTSMGVVSTFAGTGSAGFSGDHGLATLATFNFPTRIALDSKGNMYVADDNNRRVRKISAAGIVTTVAGDGTTGTGCTGDGGPATSASLGSVPAVAVDRNDSLYLVSGACVRKVLVDGTIITIAGGGPFRSDPVATNMRLMDPADIDVDSRGNVYVVESHHLVRMITPAGFVRVVAGDFADGAGSAPVGNNGFGGDGGPALGARLYFPIGIGLDAQDNVYIADQSNLRVRKVTPTTDEAPLTGTDAFAPYKVRDMASRPYAVATADLTADGRADVVVTTLFIPGQPDPDNDFKAHLFVQRSDGTLADPVKITYSSAPGNPDPSATGNNGGGIAIGDFNNDGVNDVAVGHAAGVLIIRGSRTATFTSYSFNGIFNLPAPASLVALDANRDGWLDVATLTYDDTRGEEGDYVTVGYGGPGGTVTRTTRRLSNYNYSTFPDAYELKVADFNADSFPDLVHHSGDTLEVLLNDRSGSFLPPQQQLGFGSMNRPSIGRFNADALSDIVYLKPRDRPEARLFLSAQGPGALFNPPSVLRSYDNASATVVADMNGDGRDDLVTGHFQVNAVTYHQQEAGGLRDGIKYQAPTGNTLSRQGMAVADVNGDRCKDVLIANPNLGLVILPGQHCRIRINGSTPRTRPPQTLAPVPSHVTSGARTTSEEPSGLMRMWNGPVLHRVRTETRITLRAASRMWLGWNLRWERGLRALVRKMQPGREPAPSRSLPKAHDGR